jgi:hypothetical protein
MPCLVAALAQEDAERRLAAAADPQDEEVGVAPLAGVGPVILLSRVPAPGIGRLPHGETG